MILLLGHTDFEGPQLVGIYGTLALAEYYIKRYDPATSEIVWTTPANDSPANYYATPSKAIDFFYYEIGAADSDIKEIK